MQHYERNREIRIVLGELRGTTFSEKKGAFETAETVGRLEKTINKFQEDSGRPRLPEPLKRREELKAQKRAIQIPGIK